jgi:hypothetical protein
MSPVNRSSIPQADLVRLGREVLQQVAQQERHDVTPAAGLGTTSPQRIANP